MSSKQITSPLDLHAHTSQSDGVFTPHEVVALAKKAGISTLAITDHDTMSGIAEAVTAGEKAGVKIIPGVELSVCFHDYVDVHMLGYFPKQEYQELEQLLQDFRQFREERGLLILKKINTYLQEQGKTLLREKRLKEIAKGAVGRPHLARMLVEEGLVADISEAFDDYLVRFDVSKKKLDAFEAIDLIKRNGGWAVLAHPHILEDAPNNLSLVDTKAALAELAAGGLQGLEVYYGYYSSEEAALYRGWADELGLFPTAGADFHSPDQKGQLGKFFCEQLPLTELREKIPFLA